MAPPTQILHTPMTYLTIACLHWSKVTTVPWSYYGYWWWVISYSSTTEALQVATNSETFLQDFLEIREHSLRISRNFWLLEETFPRAAVLYSILYTIIHITYNDIILEQVQIHTYTHYSFQNLRVSLPIVPFQFSNCAVYFKVWEFFS